MYVIQPYTILYLYDKHRLEGNVIDNPNNAAFKLNLRLRAAWVGKCTIVLSETEPLKPNVTSHNP
jgi:hypothetical protein